MIFLMYGLAWFVTGTTIAWVFGRMVQATNLEDGGLLLTGKAQHPSLIFDLVRRCAHRRNSACRIRQGAMYCKGEQSWNSRSR